MLDVVAISTQGLETTEPLITGLLVILPDLVAVQASLAAAYTAAVASPVIDGPADTVPPGMGQQFSQTGQVGTGRYGLNA